MKRIRLSCLLVAGLMVFNPANAQKGVFKKGIVVEDRGITVEKGGVTIKDDSQKEDERHLIMERGSDIQWRDPDNPSDKNLARIWFDRDSNYLRIGSQTYNPFFSFNFISNPSAPQGANGIFVVRDGSAIQQGGVPATTTTPYLMQFRTNSVCISCGMKPPDRIITEFALTVADQMHVGIDGEVTAPGFNTVSSRLLKKDIEPLEEALALRAFEDLNPVEFSYLESTKHRYGFIAEDTPQPMSTANSTAISATDIIAVLTSVVKQQQHQIDQVLKRIEELEKQNELR